MQLSYIPETSDLLGALSQRCVERRHIAQKLQCFIHDYKVTGSMSGQGCVLCFEQGTSSHITPVYPVVMITSQALGTTLSPEKCHIIDAPLSQEVWGGETKRVSISACNYT